MKGLQNFLILAVFVVLTGIGFEIFSQGASGTTLEIFKLGKQVTKVAAALVFPLGLYFVAKNLT